MDIDFLELDARLKKEDLLPLYLVHGDEPFLRDRALTAVLARLCADGDADHSVTRYEGDGDESLSLPLLLEDLATPSLFGPRKIALLRRAGGVLDGAGEDLAAYCTDWTGASHLVVETERVDKRRKWVKAVKKAGCMVHCKALYDQPPPWSDAPRWDNPLAQWAATEAKTLGLALSSQDAQALIDRVGTGLRVIHEELYKLSLYCKADPAHPRTVTAETVAAVVGEYNEYGIFKLTDAVGAREIARALRIVQAFYEQGLVFGRSGGVVHDENAISTILVERIYSKVREVLQAKAVLDQGFGVDGIVQKLGKHKAFAPKLAREAKGFRTEEGPDLLAACLEADLSLKTGRGRPRTVLESLLLSVAGEGL